MIPVLKKWDVEILSHLATYHLEESSVMPFGTCMLGVLRSINHPHSSNLCRSLSRLRGIGMLTAHRAHIEGYPEDIRFPLKRAPFVLAYRITERGRRVIKGYREAYPEELGATA